MPIDPLLPDLVAALRASTRLVLRAPPGAGKTTRVPAALLDAGLAGGREVLVLEPRRIAASAAATYVAGERGGAVGGEVGYRVRFEQRGGPATRLWFLTEGVFTRLLARDPFLESVGLVVLDEFHERHLQGDVALAVVRELQGTVRPDLKLVAMSATLETAPLAAYLGDCPVLTSEGRAHPVRIDYAPAADDRPLAGKVASAVRGLFEAGDDGGDVLVFLPGAAEIRRVTEALEPLAAAHQLSVVPLHGDLPLEAQQRAIRRGAQRKVVLATNVAETSLTIDGVTAVVDSGLARRARFDNRRGINTVGIAPISRAAAAQRAGRAGRTAPGRCVRLWTEPEHAHRLEREPPEILRLDLSAVILELRAWGLRDVAGFAWLDAPRAGAIARAERLLEQLGAVDPDGAVTAIGQRMLALAAPPRLARVVVEAVDRGSGERGALLAALAGERDICLDARAFGSGGGAGRWGAGPSDLLLRAELFARAERARFDPAVCRELGLDPGGLRTVDRARRQLRGSGGAARGEASEADLLRCVLAGFPDRVVRRRSAGSARGVMVGGSGVVLDDTSVVRDAELFVAVELEAGDRRERGEARVRLASAIEPAWLGEMFPAAMQRDRRLVFDGERERVVEQTQERYDDLVLDESVRLHVDRAAAGEVLAAAARSDPARALSIGDAERSLLARIDFLRTWMPELALPPDGDALLGAAVEALAQGCCSFAELRRADLLAVLHGLLTHAQRQALERQAPAQYTLPTGRAVAVQYERDKPPAVAARIQELFGLTATPRLAGGRVPLVIQLLAPNQRPVQITDDLESFWQRTYPEVRKQLRGRYPKHAWPEDPLSAPPVRGVRRAR